MLSRLHRIDLALFERVATSRPGPLDSVLPPLSRAANRSVLWLLAGAVLCWVGGRRGRRAAVRGMASVAAASTLVNGPAKYSARRQRPAIDVVPELRRLAHLPTTSSFPSGHSASAAAFAVGAALELPPLALPLGALAGAVAFSRVYTGVHYPGDVVVGAASGAVIALATAAVWPLEHAVQRHPARAGVLPAHPAGAGVVFVVNPDSRTSADSAEQVADALPQARRIDVESPDDLVAALHRETVASDVIGVIGGDGSVAAAAAVAADAGKPLAVVPGGTFNHLAQDAGLDSVDDVAAALQAGDCRELDVAEAEGTVFVNTAAFGVYPELVRLRTRRESTGWNKWLAFAVALLRITHDSEPIDIEIGGRRFCAWAVFVGNCGYEPAGIAPRARPTLSDGQLDVRVLTAARRGRRMGLLLDLLAEGVTLRPRFHSWRASEVTIRSADAPIAAALDGELQDERSSWTLTKRPRAVQLYAPAGDRS